MGEVEEPKSVRDMINEINGPVHPPAVNRMDEMMDESDGRPLQALSDPDKDEGITLSGEHGMTHFMESLGIPDVDPKRLAQFFVLFEDEMAFEIRKINRQENATFSEDAVLSLRNNVMQWVMARIWNRWAATLEPPHFLRLKVEIEWDR